MFAIRFYRIYDAGKEIDLGWLERELAKQVVAIRSSFQRVRPKSIRMEETPLQIRMEPLRVERDGYSLDLTVKARVYDIGAISLCFVYETADGGFPEMEGIGLAFAGQEGLADPFLSYAHLLQETIRSHLRDFTINTDLFEDYTIYVTNQPYETIDPVFLLNGERVPLSSQMREEILKHSLSYTHEDRIMFSWDSAILCSREAPTDLIDLIEYANVQVLELRYYDQQLTREMGKMYDDIEQAERMSWLQRLRRYRAIMRSQMETYAEISEITEKINNLIKVTEDVYYARVYATALRVLGSGQWSESVGRKIEVIHQNYSMLSDEVRNQHSNFLEWVIIILITLEFGLAIWQSIG